jgi:undecaprenyl-phosphate galactose phosphotransferase
MMRGASAIRAPRPARDQGALQRLGLRAGFAAKRVLDILAAGSLLLLLSPFFLIAVVLIRLDGGPALFGQMRVGRDGRRFRCLKFRSMCIDAQARLAAILDSDPDARAEWETHQKLRRDPRVTRIGRFLRETSLDELPQLLNVLWGDMSLVGPRPIMAPEVPGYEGDQAYYHGPSFPLYAACTPGITGLWQVSGRTDTTHDERIRLDGWYARNWSFWLDLVILLRTVRVILNRSGC